MAVLKKPLITEKMSAISEKLNQFGFVVEKNASKDAIKAEIEEMYDVEVVRVNTMRVQGKQKAKYTKAGYAIGRNASYKKAIVTLKEGQKIDFYENI
jgi:large subunit ribosomal protein L23